MPLRRLSPVLFCIPACLLSTVWAQKKPITIDTVIEQGRGGGRGAGGRAVWAPDGKRFAHLERGRVMLYDLASKSETELLSLEPLEKAAAPVPELERFDWQNRRVSETSFEWSASGKQLLLSVGGDLFLYGLDSRKWDQLTATPEAERDPKLSPDASRVAFRRGHDLYSLEVASRKVTRLTEDGGPTLLNGELDWVYPEELDLGTAYWWSPDSRHIAYLQFDTAREFVYPQVALTGPRGVAEPERYPQAGTPNPTVHLGVVPATGGNTHWMDLGDPRASLIARVYWTPDSMKLAVKRFNRVQNRLDLMLAEPGSGSSHAILSEADPYWINNNDLFRFLPNGDFLWGSERDGFQHLYLYSQEGKLRKRLTEGNWEVTELAGVDQARQKVYFVSSEASPLERQLYSIGLNGKDRVRISQGAGTHGISMSPDASSYLDTFSSLTEPSSRVLRSADGAELAVYRPSSHALTDEYDLLPTEIVSFKNSTGTELYARLIKPKNFHAGEKYPAIVMVYGGPGAQSIRNAWTGANWDQVLAHRGFVIWQVDNRGSKGRGHAFESPIYHRTNWKESNIWRGRASWIRRGSESTAGATAAT
jgi:dipeptidyl-peptidase 4